MIRADLHIHTVASDGADSVETVVNRAKTAGLDLMAVTDHDTIASLPEAVKTAEDADIKIIPGIEFSVVHTGEMHILGYFTDLDNDLLVQKVRALVQARISRMRTYIDIIQKSGIQITMADVEAQAGGNILSRAHIAQALTQIGAVGSPDEAFDKYLRKLPQEMVRQYKTPKQEAIDIIHAAGGAAILAHPVYNLDDHFEDTLDELIMYGLNGLEAYHPDHSDENAAYFEEIAKKKALLVTAGSDYHGPLKPEITIGCETRTSDYHQFCLSIFLKQLAR